MADQVTYKCMRCGNEWRGEYDVENLERMCPKCRSNSVRRLKNVEPQNQPVKNSTVAQAL